MGRRQRRRAGGRHGGEGGGDGSCTRRGEALAHSRAGGSSGGSGGQRCSDGNQLRVLRMGRGADSWHELRAGLSHLNGSTGVVRLMRMLSQSCRWAVRCSWLWRRGLRLHGQGCRLAGPQIVPVLWRTTHRLVGHCTGTLDPPLEAGTRSGARPRCRRCWAADARRHAAVVPARELKRDPR